MTASNVAPEAKNVSFFSPELVVIERGAPADALPKASGRRVVLAQDEAEDLGAFARRVAETTSALVAASRSPRAALVLVGHDSSEDAGQARYLTARAILRSLAARRVDSLVFAVRDGARHRHELHALAAVLSESLGDAKPAVRVEVVRRGAVSERRAA